VTESDQDTAAGELRRDREASREELEERSQWLRLEILRVIQDAGLGHYSSTFSCAEVLSVLYYRTMRLRPQEPAWENRDRFLLGKGHVAVGLWPILADLGYFPRSWLADFGKLGAPLTDHPDMRTSPGIDFSSGALGHNLSVGVGMSLAARLLGRDHRTFVLTGDGEIHEGQLWEAVMSASHYRLGNLVAVVDANGSCGDGPTSQVMNIEPLPERFAAFGWRTVEIDGHDVGQVMDAFDSLPDPGSDQPTCVVARTLKGKGVSFMEANPRDWHLGILGPEDYERARAEIMEVAT